MAAHTLYLYEPLKTTAGAFLKTRRKVPSVLLGIESNGRLVQIAISIKNVRIGVLPGTYYVVDLLNTFVNGVMSFCPELHYIQRIIRPVRLIIIVERRVINQC